MAATPEGEESTALEMRPSFSMRTLSTATILPAADPAATVG